MHWLELLGDGPGKRPIGVGALGTKPVEMLGQHKGSRLSKRWSLTGSNHDQRSYVQALGHPVPYQDGANAYVPH